MPAGWCFSIAGLRGQGGDVVQGFRTVTTAFVTVSMLAVGCSRPPAESTAPPASASPAAVNPPPVGGNAPRLRGLVDTDANNELDDQHALAYLLFNGRSFDVEGITVNATR